MLMSVCLSDFNSKVKRQLFRPSATVQLSVSMIETCTKHDNGSENFFAQLKQYRAIATRYDKRATNFLSAIYLAAAVIWLN
jgi:hypothetical protein